MGRREETGATGDGLSETAGRPSAGARAMPPPMRPRWARERRSVERPRFPEEHSAIEMRDLDHRQRHD